MCGSGSTCRSSSARSQRNRARVPSTGTHFAAAARLDRAIRYALTEPAGPCQAGNGTPGVRRNRQVRWSVENFQLGMVSVIILADRSVALLSSP